MKSRHTEGQFRCDQSSVPHTLQKAIIQRSPSTYCQAALHLTSSLSWKARHIVETQSNISGLRRVSCFRLHIAAISCMTSFSQHIEMSSSWSMACNQMMRLGLESTGWKVSRTRVRLSSTNLTDHGDVRLPRLANRPGFGLGKLDHLFKHHNWAMIEPHKR